MILLLGIALYFFILFGGLKKTVTNLNKKKPVQKEEAVLIKKYREEARGAEDWGDILFPDYIYNFDFKIGSKIEKFTVAKYIYDQIEQGEVGLLTYQGCLFHRFDTKDKSVIEKNPEMKL